MNRRVMLKRLAVGAFAAPAVLEAASVPVMDAFRYCWVAVNRMGTVQTGNGKKCPDDLYQLAYFEMGVPFERQDRRYPLY